MIIENLESLKSWLIQTLTPICDADPDTLAKYVIALVKKDKPLDELRESCFRDLYVFLQDKTKAFVSCLFDALQSKSYVVSDDVKIGDSNQKDSEGSVVSKEGVRPGSRSADDALKRMYVSSDRENSSQELSRTDGRLLDERVGRKEHYGVNDKDYRPANSYRRLIDTRKTSLPYQSCSSESESNRTAYEGTGARPGESAPHHAPNPYEPFLAKQAQSGYRPRTSSLHRRDVDSSRRDHQQPASRNSVRYHQLNDKPRHYPSLNKVYGSETSGHYGSPARSLESDRADGRRAPAHPWPQRNPDVRKNRSPRPLRSPIFVDRSRTRSRTASRTPSRSVDPVPALRSSRSRSRSPARLKSQSPSLSRRSSRSRSPAKSRSPACNDTSSRHASAGEEAVNSRSSTPLEEEKYKVSELQLKMRYDARPAPRPRCRDYDEKGFCIRGDLCDFDHGNDPVIVDSIKIPFPSGRLSDPATGTLPPVPLPLPLCPPLLAPMPYISRVVSQTPFEDPKNLMAPPMPYPQPEGGTHYLGPPPHLMPPVPHLRGIDMRLYPPPGPPHMYSFPMMPQSFVGNRPLTLQPEPTRAVRDLYQPVVLPADPYLPEPYSPKSPTYQSMSKSSDSREANAAIDTAGFSAQIFGYSQVSVSRHSNLVRVPTEESQKLVEEKSDTAVCPGTKRSADVLDTSSGSMASTAQPPPHKKTTFEHPGVRHGGVNNTTLELRKIPREQNTIANINDHFSKFGIIVNLQVGWDGDQQAALVSFASNAQAQLAYRSQEPFLNNRFIKIFWHNAEKPSQPQALPVSAADAPRQRIIIPERHKLQLNNRLKNATQAAKTITPTVQQQQQQQSSQGATSSVKDAGINSSAVSQPDAIVTPSATIDNGTTPVSTLVSATTTVKSVPEAAYKGSTKLQRQSSKEIPNKSVLLKQQLEVQKKLQELLTKHIDQQKILFEKLEKDKSTLTAEEKANIIETIKLLAKKIEELKTSITTISSTIEPDLASKGSVVSKTAVSISTSVGAIPSRGSLRKVNNSVTRSLGNSGKQSFVFGGSHPSTKGPIFQDSKQAQKALLDTELDLINRQKDGSDATELLKRVAALKEEAASLGLLGPTLNPGSKPGGSLSHVRGRGGTVARGRGIVQGARRWSGGFAGAGHTVDRPHTVDRRPKQLMITGFLTDEKDDLLSHLQEFGELDDSVFDLSVPSLSVTFKSRLHAEKAAVDGRSFNGKELKMVWQKPASVLTERNIATNADLLTTEKAEVKLLKELSDDAVDMTKSLVNSLPSDVLQKEDIVKSIAADVVEKPKSDGSVLKKARLYSLTGEEEEFDEDALLGIDEEDEDDNHEGGRPWRR